MPKLIEDIETLATDIKDDIVAAWASTEATVVADAQKLWGILKPILVTIPAIEGRILMDALVVAIQDLGVGNPGAAITQALSTITGEEASAWVNTLEPALLNAYHAAAALFVSQNQATATGTTGSVAPSA